MWVCKCFLDFKKEEKWLEEKGRQGYQLKEVNCGFYRFDYVNTPVDLNIKIDYRTFNSIKDFQYYCALFEDSGWQHIAGSRWSGSQYFVKARPDAGDDIFSDGLSRAGRYKRFALMWLSLALAYLPLMVVFFLNGSIDLHKILNLKSLYLTPGLWDMKGTHFLRAFLFETPFAIMRGFGWVIFIFIVLIFVYYTLKAYLLYKKDLKKS